MQQFIEYLDSALPDRGTDKILYKFKRELLDEMNDRYLEVSRRGITNQRVITDLIISEHQDIAGEYKAYHDKQAAKRRAKARMVTRIIGSLVYFVGMIVLFFALSFSTDRWGHTWLVIVDGILLWLFYILTVAAKKITSFKRIFHIFARILLAGAIMILSVAVFLFCLVALSYPKSWVILIAGIAMMFIVDAAYTYITKVRFAIIYYLIYIPIIATMLYIILSGLYILSWSTGWILIILSLFLDVVVMYISMVRNRRYNQEVVDQWQEN